MKGFSDSIVDDSSVQKHVGDGAISVACGRFGSQDGLVDAQFASSRLSHFFDECINAYLYRALLDKRSHRDGAGIDHGIEWAARLLVKFNGVESFAARLNTDML